MAKHAILLLLIVAGGVSVNSNAVSNRTGKFIGWWGVGVVRFENVVCGASNGLIGICYTRRQCLSIGGYASGKCARNIGVCCVYQASCGTISSNNNTYFSNPRFPNTFTGASVCTLTIQRCNVNVCQMRIDFLSFTLAQPNADGVCVNDAMTISGAGTNVGRICGENTGQHIYIDFSYAKDVVINIFTSAAVSSGRQWNLRIAQIGCDSTSRAPTGCLMYYTATSGTVRSFNYGETVTPGQTRQLANMNYGVCIRTEPEFCSIQWSTTGNNLVSFSVTGNQPGLIFDQNCVTDYIIIPDGSVIVNGVQRQSDRFCGSTLTTVTSPTRPFVLYAVTDANELGDTQNNGFSLSYSQQQCINNFL
ncbi:hypothetical protein RN001_015120 [Aquatica leii]|uniref:CUB domain-containing protein n=1 Tax=Aquatica leii TaxID=1421715 RepID=A0AAN7S6I3_9COLE|nr:hypothetical protein RN001_015120 [Aquatica leii]